MKYDNFSYEFVEYIPERIQEGVIYISIQFGTAVHNCACGCGREVVTPLSPADWTLIFDGVSISLTPSIGNWSFPCQSHYWIKNNLIHWAPKWSQDKIDSGRANDKYLRDNYYGYNSHNPVGNKRSEIQKPKKSFIKNFVKWIFAKLNL